MTTETTKGMVVALAVVGATILGALGELASESIIAVYMASLGYVFGNGHGIITSARTVAREAEKVAEIAVVKAHREAGRPRSPQARTRSDDR